MNTDERNILLKIAYDGSNFCGWQRQPGSRTVCGELETVLSRLCGIDIKLDAVSRTDAGVHALGQQASFKGVFGLPTDRIAKAANDALAMDRLQRVGEIAIIEAKEMPPDFHARYSAKGKRYIYRISDSAKMNVFRRNYCYQVGRPLDVSAMREAADFIAGEHDFRCFMAMGSSPQKSTVRNIFEADVRREDEDIVFSVAGDGFLYNMVRIITGTLVETGLGRRSPEDMQKTLASFDRSEAGHTAPPQGLYLKEVFYTSPPFTAKT